MILCCGFVILGKSLGIGHGLCLETYTEVILDSEIVKAQSLWACHILLSNLLAVYGLIVVIWRTIGKEQIETLLLQAKIG